MHCFQRPLCSASAHCCAGADRQDGPISHISQDEAALLITFAGQVMQILVVDHLELSAIASEAFDIAEAMVMEYRRCVFDIEPKPSSKV
jgi:hypothetical protein